MGESTVKVRRNSHYRESRNAHHPVILCKAFGQRREERKKQTLSVCFFGIRTHKGKGYSLAFSVFIRPCVFTKIRKPKGKEK